MAEFKIFRGGDDRRMTNTSESESDAEEDPLLIVTGVIIRCFTQSNHRDYYLGSRFDTRNLN